MPTLPIQGGQPARVLLVEDHRVFREWLGHLITRDKAFFICGEAENVADAIELLASARPDLIIVDLTLKGSSGLDLIRHLKAHRLNIPALVLSMHDSEIYAERVSQAGARGFVSKFEATSLLLPAMEHVLRGGFYFHKTSTAA